MCMSEHASLKSFYFLCQSTKRSIRPRKLQLPPKPKLHASARKKVHAMCVITLSFNRCLTTDFW